MYRHEVVDVAAMNRREVVHRKMDLVAQKRMAAQRAISKMHV